MNQDRWYQEAKAAWVAEEKAKASEAAEAAPLLEQLRVALEAIDKADKKVQNEKLEGHTTNVIMCTHVFVCICAKPSSSQLGSGQSSSTDRWCSSKKKAGSLIVDACIHLKFAALHSHV